MKNLKNAILIAAVSATVFSSCKNEDVTPVAPVTVTDNNIPNGTFKMSLSVQVKASSVASARTEGLKDAVVTVSVNGSTQSATVNESGIATFTGLPEGRASIFVKSPSVDFLSVNELVDLAYNGSLNVGGTNSGTDSEQLTSIKKDITLQRRAAKVSAKIYGDFDFNGAGNNTTITSGVTVTARVDSKFEPNVFTTTTDGTGMFTFTNLPEGVPVALSINFQTTDTFSDPAMPESRDWEIGGFTKSVSTTLISGETVELGNITATDF